jgi:hypothetical protein
VNTYWKAFAIAITLESLGTVAFAQNRIPTVEEMRDQQRIVQQLAKEAQAEDLKRLVESYVPLQVQVVISKYQGEKKIASAPYLLSVNANDHSLARLRVGAEVPLPTAATPAPSKNEPSPIVFGGPVQYKNIGTNIDCMATGPFLERYKLELTIEESSVAPLDTPGMNSPPAIRSFKISNSVMLKDGQSAQFSTATDKITGETTKIDVTVKVTK